MVQLLAFAQNSQHPHTRELFFSVTALCVAILVAISLHFLAFRIIARIRKTQPKQRPRLIAALQRLYHPARFIVVLTGVAFVLPGFTFPLMSSQSHSKRSLSSGSLCLAGS